MQKTQNSGLDSRQSCGNCNAWDRISGDNGCCLAEPPKPLVVGFSDPGGLSGSIGAISEPIVQSFFPPIKAHGWCRAWAPKNSDANSAISPTRMIAGNENEKKAIIAKNGEGDGAKSFSVSRPSIGMPKIIHA